MQYQKSLYGIRLNVSSYIQKCNAEMSMLFTEFLLIQNALNDNFQRSLIVTHFASDFGIQWIRSYSLKQLAIEGSKKSQISQNNKSFFLSAVYSSKTKNLCDWSSILYAENLDFLPLRNEYLDYTYITIKFHSPCVLTNLPSSVLLGVLMEMQFP